MRRALVPLAALVIGLGLAGCGQPGAPSVAGAGSLASSSPAGCPSASAPVVAITEADRDAQVCLSVGQKLRVILKSAPDNLWQPIVAEGSAIAPTADGTLTLVRGATGAAFVGVQPGQARVTSSRRICPSASPGTAACHGSELFQVMVTVR